MTILVFGSQEEFEPLVQPFLAGKGHALFFALSSEEVIRQARTERLDLIIMDLDMAVEDDLRTLKELKDAAETMLTPVIIVARSSAAISYLHELSKSVKEDTVAIVGEPGDLARLEEMVGRVFAKQGSGSGCLTDETLSKLTDGELCAEESERGRAHLSWCAECQRRYEQWGRTDSELKDLFRTALVGNRRSGQCLSPWQLAGYLRGHLSAEERGQVESHFLLCSCCTRELVTLHELLQEFDEKEPEPLSEEVMDRLTQNVDELLRKERSPLICMRCQDSIPLESAACPRCGAVVARTEQRERAAPLPVRWFGTRAGKIAVSLVGVSLAASVVLSGISVYQNRRPDVLAIAADNVLAGRLLDEIEEEIEVLGQVAMPEPRPTRFEVPENVARIARALVAKYYYDESVAEKALRHKNIEDVFKTLNRLETKGAKSRLLPKFPNRILSPDELRFLKGELSGEFAGIGAYVRHAPGEGGEEIVGFSEDSPAKEAGLQVGDTITEVDGTPLRGLDLAQATASWYGPANTRVSIKVARKRVPDLEVLVLRKKVTMPRIERRVLGADTGYIRATRFDEGAVEDLEEALIELRNSKVHRLVVDLRGHRGSGLQSAVDVAALFLQEGALIASVEGKNNERRLYAETAPMWEGVLAVLVDNRTISSGELVVAALKGSQRAVLIGERTAGKGTVQTVYRLGDGYAIQVTTNVLADPDGFIFNKRGIDPDVEVAENLSGSRGSPREISTDKVVRTALERLERTPVIEEKESSTG